MQAVDMEEAVDRLLSYMQAKLPVLTVTDTATDIRKVIVKNGFGWWCEINDADAFYELIYIFAT